MNATKHSMRVVASVSDAVPRRQSHATTMAHTSSGLATPAPCKRETELRNLELPHRKTQCRTTATSFGCMLPLRLVDSLVEGVKIVAQLPTLFFNVAVAALSRTFN